MSDALDLAAGFRFSPYFQRRNPTGHGTGEALMLAHEVDGIIRIRSDFGRQ